MPPSIIVILTLLLQGPAAGEIDRAIENGIADGVFPGAVVMVGTGNRVLHARGYGRFTWSGDSRAPEPDSTLWDLASLTKVVATTPAAMLLVQQGKLELDQPVQRYLPEFTGAGKEQVTVRHLLEHRSGLRAFLDLREDTDTPQQARTRVLEEELRWEPGGRVVYSDLNAMLLGWVVERASGDSLALFLERELYDPAGMTHTMYRPPRSLHGSTAPVGLWRGHVIAGRLHDQNAVQLGGVSGHAGLYSTGSDLARYARIFLTEGLAPDSTRIFRPGVVRHFTRRGAGNRALGWEMRDTASSDNTGNLLSAEAYGHGGYTGASIWIDPQRDLFVIVLTNRVFAPRTSRSITKLKAVRARVADAAVRLRDEQCGSAAAATGAGC